MRWSHEKTRFDIPGFRMSRVASLIRCACPESPNGTVFGPSAAGGRAPGSIVACPREADLTSDRFTPRVAAQYRFSDDVLGYASYLQGFKPGGFNTHEIVEFNDQLYQPERVAACERGGNRDGSAIV